MSKTDAAVRGRAAADASEDAPDLARRLLKWVSAALLVALMVGAGHLLLRWEPQYLPIRVVSVEGEVRRLPLTRLQETVLRHLRGGILTQDLAVLKEAVEELAWVHTASLRRVWPDRLVLSAHEHNPLARWGEDGLVTAAGIVFRPQEPELPRGLARLSGDDRHSVDVVERYLDWRPRLEALGLGITALGLDARGAWTLHTDGGFSLALGKHHIAKRMGRFLRVYPSIVAAGRPATVDMRYSNGLAVSWRGPDGGQGQVGGPRAQTPEPRVCGLAEAASHVDAWLAGNAEPGPRLELCANQESVQVLVQAGASMRRAAAPDTRYHRS